MNERSGQTIYDWSGNRNNGMLGSTPGVDANDPTWIKGIFNVGSALRFDGDDYVTIPDSASLRPDNLTVSAWVRSAGGPGPFAYLVAKGASGCFASSFALYTTETGRAAFYVYDGNTFWVRSPEAPASIWDGAWHNLAGTYDGHTLRLFVDGSEVGSGTPTNISVAYDLPSPAATLGSFQGDCAFYLVGDIDGVSVWDRALPIGQIADLVRSLVGGR